MPESTSFDVSVIDTTTIFPESKKNYPKTIPLSIIDCTVSFYASAAFIWFYDPPTDPESALSSSHLQVALSKTLHAYPQWCGRLSYTTYKANSGHNKRYRRVRVTYNAPTDLGVTFVTATSPKVLSEILPDPSARSSGLKAWDGSKLCYNSGLYPTATLALSNDRTPPDAPNVTIQLTSFACGSNAVAISVTHALADAQSVSQFAKDFASVSRAMINSEPLPNLFPVFDPQRVDAFAVGNIDAETPDPALQEKARKLPLHRYDNYLHVPGQLWPVHNPPGLDTVSHLQRSPMEPLPWHTYDTKAPVSYRILHYSPSEIQHIYTRATAAPDAPKLSQHDALLAHVWTRIINARNLEPGTRVYLDMSVGLRQRIEPPLPDNFLGSPIINAAVPTTTPPSGTPISLPQVASSIRNTLQAFTLEMIAAQLHDLAFEVSPQQIWRCFLGSQHTLVTSCVRLGMEEVDFVGGKGGRIRFVWPISPPLDGLVVVTEAGGEKGDAGAHWTRNGVDFNVYLEEGTMGRLLLDKDLWGGV